MTDVPDLVGASEAARILGVKGPNIGPLVEKLPRRKLRSGTVWLREHVERVADARRAGSTPVIVGKPPSVVSSREASEILGVTSTYVRKLLPEPQELAMGPVWLERDARRIAAKRARPHKTTCGKHGRRGIMAGPSGKEYCGICNRRRARERRQREKEGR